MKKNVRFLGLVLTVVMALIQFGTVSKNVRAAGGSTASAVDVHIIGHFSPGQTLTAEYTYFDPLGLEEVPGSVKYQWYQQGSTSNAEPISGETGKTYTIPANIDRSWHYFVAVTTSNADGEGEPVFSGLYNFYYAPAVDSVRGYSPHITTNDYKGHIKPGVTLRANYAYFSNSKAEGNTTYLWTRRANLSDTPETILSATGKTYVVTEEDNGKWIEVTITPYDVDGNKGGAVTAKTYVGNLLAKNIQTAVLTTPGTSAITEGLSPVYPFKFRLAYQLDKPIRTQNLSAATTLVPITVDLGKIEDFDRIYINTSGTVLDPAVYYSSDGANYTKIANYPSGYITDHATEKDSEGNPRKVLKTGDLVIPVTTTQARYFKFEFYPKGAAMIYGFFPYSTEGFAANLEIQSVGYGGTVSGSNLISDIIAGVPLQRFLDSVETEEVQAVKEIVDSEGNALSADDLACLTINTETVRDYRLRISLDGKEKIYNLQYGGALQLQNFDTLTVGEKYYCINTASQGKNISSTIPTYWYGTANAEKTEEGLPYAEVVSIGENDNALRFVPRGLVPKDSNMVSIRLRTEVPSRDAVYLLSFSFKPSDNLSLTANARIGHHSSQCFINEAFLRFNASDKKIYAYGNEAGTYQPGEWYHAEVALDYNTDMASIWVNGVKLFYGQITYDTEIANKDYYTPQINISTSDDNVNDMDSYIDNIALRRVYDITTHLIPLSGGLILYDAAGNPAQLPLAGKTVYKIKNDSFLLLGESSRTYVAIYRKNYADNSSGEPVSCELVSVYLTDNGSSRELVLTTPEKISEQYPSGNIKSRIIIKSFVWSGNLEPIVRAQIWE